MRRFRYTQTSRFFYAQLLRLAVPLMLLRLLWRSRRVPGYRARLFERLGFGLPEIPRDAAPLWIHAVSVGETLAIAPLIELLLARHPQTPLLVTSTTPTGAAQVARLFDGRVTQCWVPFDTPGAVRRCLDHFRPRGVVLVETEVWPTLIFEARERAAAVLLLNARLSARSARGYGRVGALASPTLAALDVIAAQHDADARRFRALGARLDAVQVVGSVKYDLDLDALKAQCNAIRDQLGPVLAQRRVWVVASTHPGEETQVLTAFRAWRAEDSRALLLLAPRHPERTEALLSEAVFDGLAWQRRSTHQALRSDTDVLLWDTLGELGAAMGLAEVVFVGGSLVPRGGHNPLEAAVWGAPVLTGPHVFNFEATYRALLRVGAAQTVVDGDGLTAGLLDLVQDQHGARARGDAGRRVMQDHRGALERQYALLLPYLAAEAVGAGGATK